MTQHFLHAILLCTVFLAGCASKSGVSGLPGVPGLPDNPVLATPTTTRASEIPGGPLQSITPGQAGIFEQTAGRQRAARFFASGGLPRLPGSISGHRDNHHLYRIERKIIIYRTGDNCLDEYCRITVTVTPNESSGHRCP